MSKQKLTSSTPREEQCCICAEEVTPLFQKTILGRHATTYYQCKHCHFVQTGSPHWLDEAYAEAINRLDLGLATRSVNNTHFLTAFILKYCDASARYLDYGGGYGLTVRLMRDQGFDFYREDKFCANLFAQHFDLKDINENHPRFELLTAFEVFEHLAEPRNAIAEMLQYTDSLLFTTELIPEKLQNNPAALQSWHYLIPETGQHISLYSKESLRCMAKENNLQLETRGNMHLLSRRKYKSGCLRLAHSVKLGRKLLRSNRSSLLQADYHLAFQHLSKDISTP